MSKPFHETLGLLTAELNKRFESEYQVKALLWDRLRFAADVLNGRWTASKVEDLGKHLDEILKEAESIEDAENRR